MHVHDTLGGGLHGFDEQFSDGFECLGIDHEGKDPIVRLGFEVREEMRDRTVLEAMAREGRDIKLTLSEQPVPPLDIGGGGGVECQNHELLGMVERIDQFVCRHTRDEVIRLFVRHEAILDESRRDVLCTHLYRHILRAPRCLGITGRN